jgi:hypothetical protein
MNSVERNKRRLQGSTAEIPKRNRGNVDAVPAQDSSTCCPKVHAYEPRAEFPSGTSWLKRPISSYSQASDLIVFLSDFHLP